MVLSKFRIDILIDKNKNNESQMNHVVICSSNFPNHCFKRKILHQEFSACLHETLYEHIHPIPKARKIFHIPWRCLPKNLGVFSFRLVLPLSEISFKYNHFLGASIKNCLSKFWIKILPIPTLKYKFIHMEMENLVGYFF